MLPYKSLIQIDRNGDTSIYLQVANALRQEIVMGRLVAGTRLPSSRMMAQLLEVHRKTIVSAYEELDSQGWIQTRKNAGTFVSEVIPEYAPRAFSEKIPAPKELPCRAHLETNPSLRKTSLVRIAHYKSCKYHFDFGYPDLRLAPIQEYARHYNGLIKSIPTNKSLNYAIDYHGNRFLRQQIAIYLSQTRGINTSPENILITRGSTMAFYLFFFGFMKPGDHIAMTMPGYSVVREMVILLKGNPVYIGVDEDGMNLDELEAQCKKKEIKFVYVMPHHHNPTTVILSPERRMRLIEMSERYNFMILEDDYDFEFHFDGSPILPLMSYNLTRNVLYAGSFSKTVAPSFRIGYVVAEPYIIENLVKIRSYIDRTGEPLIERSVGYLLSNGEIQRYHRKALKAYRARRDLLCELLEKELGDYVTFRKPEGGTAIWVKFREDKPVEEIYEKCIPNDLYLYRIEQVEGYYLNGTRLGFASMNLEELRKAFDILRDVVVGM